MEVMSLYVDNLPRIMTKGSLQQLFKSKGRVVDAYVLYKWRMNTENLLGFVLFYHMEEATNAIKNLHGIEIRGWKLSVQLAAYGRSQHKETRN